MLWSGSAHTCLLGTKMWKWMVTSLLVASSAVVYPRVVSVDPFYSCFTRLHWVLSRDTVISSSTCTLTILMYLTLWIVYLCQIIWSFKLVALYVEAQISKCLAAFERLRGESPACITRLLTRYSDLHSRSTRYANHILVCSKLKRKLDGGKTFSVTTCQLWNSFPMTLLQKTSIKSFKKDFKKAVFSWKPTEFESFYSSIRFLFIASQLLRSTWF